jgi:hypothetical protein
MKKPGVLNRVLLIVSFSFFFAYLTPLFIVKKTKGLYVRENTESDLSLLLHGNAKAIYNKQNQDIAFIQHKIDSLCDPLCPQCPILDSQFETRINQIKVLKEAKKEVENNAIFSPFNNNRISFIWPIAIALLLFANYILLSEKIFVFRTKFVLTYIVVLVLSCFSLLMRNFGQLTIGRKIYSVYNWDINKYLFYFQLLLLIISVFLIVLIWFKCFEKLKHAQSINETPVTFEAITSLMRSIKQNYVTWQILSLCLIGVFGAFSYHFWQSVIVEKDYRYFTYALTFDILWITTWIISVIPLNVQQQNWEVFVEKILFLKSAETEKLYRDLDSDQFKIYLRNFEVASSNNKVISSILTFVSLIFPIIKLLF